jgi:hypothetical protein
MAEVANVAVKLPDFWTADPETWLAQAESQFRRGRVTVQQTMFDHVLCKLPPDVVAAVRDLALHPPEEDPYTALKERLLSSFKPSKWEQVSKLLHFPDLGDRRPTALMDAMLATLPPDASPNYCLFQGIFLERMPDYIRSHLSLPKFETSREMAVMADTLWAGNVRGGSAVSAVMPARTSRSPDRRTASPDVRSSQSGRQQRAATPANRTAGLCRIHKKWGQAANFCLGNCTWTGNGRATGGN